jgi:hypothetical protein
MGISIDVPGDEDPKRPRVKPELPPAVIPFSTFVEAQQDPKIAKVLKEAKAESDKLKAEGKIHF